MNIISQAQALQGFSPISVPLYNPQDLKKALKDLEEKHGKEKLERAQQIASMIFEENNPRTIQAGASGLLRQLFYLLKYIVYMLYL